MRVFDHATILLSPSFHGLRKERLAQWPPFCVLNTRENASQSMSLAAYANKTNKYNMIYFSGFHWPPGSPRPNGRPRRAGMYIKNIHTTLLLIFYNIVTKDLRFQDEACSSTWYTK